MYRYTTPSFKLKLLGVDFSKVEIFRVIFKQNPEDVQFLDSSCSQYVNCPQVVKEFLKNDENISSEDNLLTVTLTQEETARFQQGRVAVQLRVKFEDGTVSASSIAHCLIKRTLDEEVI